MQKLDMNLVSYICSQHLRGKNNCFTLSMENWLESNECLSEDDL